jgi:hypothetical protein
MSPHKFTVGQRIVVKEGVHFGYSGIHLGACKGTVITIWPKAGLLKDDRWVDQYGVQLDLNPAFAGYIVFGEDQLTLDVLEQLAAINEG